MKRICRRVRQTLTTHGPHALRSDPAACRHLEECADCFARLETAAGLDDVLDALPARDAPDEVVGELLRRPEVTTAEAPSAPPRRPAATFHRRISGTLRRRTWLLATATGMLAVVAVIWLSTRRAEPRGRSYLVRQVPSTAPAEEPATGAVDADSRRKLSAPDYGADVYAAKEAGAAETTVVPVDQEASEIFADRVTVAEGREVKDEKPRPNANAMVTRFRRPASEAAEREEEAAFGTGSGKVKRLPPPAPVPARERPERQLGSLEGEARWGDADQVAGLRDALPEDLPDTSDQLFPAPSSSLEVGLAVGGKIAPETGGRADENLPVAPAEQDEADVAREPSPAAIRAARELLRQRSTSAGLTFQPPTGYWANTYLPGDPVLRLLEARLRDRDRGPLAGFASGPLRLHDAARQAAQPFDPPASAALGLALQADRPALDGESRLLVQVGLQATRRHSGRRPAMNVGIVLDLRGEVEVEVAAAMRALVTAFGQAREVGDRFHLLVAGQPGGVVIAADDYRYGPLTVAMRHYLSGPQIPPRSPLGTRGDAPTHPRGPGGDGGVKTGPTLSLVDAVRTATEVVRSGDDPTAPLGSSAVVVVTGQALGGATDELATVAHRGAVDGVPLSVVGIGPGVRLDELDGLALAGQGNRRLLPGPREAAALVDRELAAVGRVVARAVRLRIRLAPGVRLVDVLGSRRLDVELAARVREAERAIDRRLDRNLGIRSDRGADEEGIQIVIPSFYAGDAHVVLLDAVAPGPGPIAEVTVRYKDLVHLRNGVARAHLSLPRGRGEPGALERNVLKNLLAHRLRQALEAAGRSLTAGDADDAGRRLREIRTLLAGLRVEVRGFDQDRDLARDLAMVDEYLALLNAGAGGEPEPRVLFAESLRYAGRRKVLPPPAGERQP